MVLELVTLAIEEKNIELFKGAGMNRAPHPWLWKCSLLMRPKVTCLLEVCFRNSSLNMILSGVAWEKRITFGQGKEKSRLRTCMVTFSLHEVTFGEGWSWQVTFGAWLAPSPNVT
ncbi:hypothetical protein PIB30_099212 [Stylosanthes scabra]|uniref:Uncharacterized protein n=1 Tax=Stylosanthes scabra TaxID=79078 RepID=A0ABU6WWG3_9FABA|nr:hypothetical protein [Stylosanthes scabra]